MREPRRCVGRVQDERQRDLEALRRLRPDPEPRSTEAGRKPTTGVTTKPVTTGCGGRKPATSTVAGRDAEFLARLAQGGGHAARRRWPSSRAAGKADLPGMIPQVVRAARQQHRQPRFAARSAARSTAAATSGSGKSAADFGRQRCAGRGLRVRRRLACRAVALQFCAFTAARRPSALDAAPGEFHGIEQAIELGVRQVGHLARRLRGSAGPRA